MKRVRKEISKLDFNESNTALGLHALDWKDAVRKCGEILVQNGCAEERYVDKIIENVETLGPYIVITDNFAMPHARPEDGAIRQGYALVTFDEPVSFGDKDASVFLGFTAEDSDKHIGLLQQIVELLNAGKVPEIAAAQTIDELRKIAE